MSLCPIILITRKVNGEARRKKKKLIDVTKNNISCKYKSMDNTRKTYNDGTKFRGRRDHRVKTGLRPKHNADKYGP